MLLANPRYDDLPRAVDPPSGWLQNTNDPPWTCTDPAVLDPGKFPPYMAPRGMSFRSQRSTRMLREEDRFTLDKLVEAKHSTHSELADRMLDELIAAVRSSANEKAKQAAEVLAKWDRSTEAASRGAILFLNFGARWMLGPGAHPFAVPWSAADPLGTPRQIADPSRAVTFLAQAAESTATRFGSIDVPWGEFNRFARDSVDLPGNGGPDWLGIFRVIDFNPPLATHTRAGGGDSFIAAVEFSNPVQVRVLTTYGNSSQPGSPHRTDQLPFAARKELRPAWRTRADVERHLEATDVLR